jgi:hypothetical protein
LVIGHNAYFTNRFKILIFSLLRICNTHTDIHDLDFVKPNFGESLVLKNKIRLTKDGKKKGIFRRQ